MSSNCPPQLHLELPPNTTSFKRSFDQFGFDIESPLGGSDGTGASGSDGNDRNKRARSASSFSDDDRSTGSSSSSTLASGSSLMSADHESSVESHISSAPRRLVPHLTLNIRRASLEPPRLPTPQIQDIDMTDYPLPEVEQPEEADPAPQASASSAVSATSQAEESYRLSLERFNAFDSQISALRRSRSPSLPRSPTPPPVLPPLELLGEEAPINPTVVSFLHPPAQPSPPLPHSLYNYGPSRSHQPGSRTASRNELLDDPRLPHENHTQTEALVESSTPSRVVTDLSDDSQTDEEWNQITENIRPPGRPWAYWDPNTEDDDSHDDLEDDEEEEEEVQEVLEQPSSANWSSPIPPTLGELRSPSPLFEHLDDLDPPTVSPSPPAPRRAQEQAFPPTLPPIEDQVLSQDWDPMRVLDTVYGRDESRERPTRIQRASQPPPRIPTPDLPRLRQSISVDDDFSANATAGSSSSDGTAISPLNWLDNEVSPWFLRSPEEDPGSSTQVPRSNANSTTITSSSSSSSSATAGGSSSSILDTYAASRLQALQGIGTALEGIGQVLRESEITLAPYLRDGSSSSNSVATTSTVSTLTEGSSSTRSQASSARGSSEGRTSAWRSTSASEDRIGETQTQRRLRINTPPMIPPSEARSFMEPIGQPAEPSQSARSIYPPGDEFRDLLARFGGRRRTLSLESEAMSEEPSYPRSDDFRELLARYGGPRRTPPLEPESLRSRALAIQAAFNEIDRPLRSAGGDNAQEMEDDSSQPRGRAYPSWSDHSASSRRERERDLPTNTSMLFRDGPASSAIPSDSQSSSTDRSFGSGSRIVDHPRLPRLRELHERERERTRDAERRERGVGTERWERDRELDRDRTRPLFAPRVFATSNATLLAHHNTALSNHLRARAYVGQSSTQILGHPHSHSHPITSTVDTGESEEDAQRRSQRLGMIQSQRLRAMQARVEASSTPLPPLLSANVSTFSRRQQEGEVFPSRRPSSPDLRQQNVTERLAEQRARLRARVLSTRTERDQDREPLSSGSGTTEQSDELSMNAFTLPSRGSGTSIEPNLDRPRPSSALRSIRRSLDRLREASVSLSSEHGLPGSLTHSAFHRPPIRASRLDRIIPREPLRDFLPAPSLPSPGLHFDPISHSHDLDASEQPDHNRVSIVRSGLRSPSPVYRRLERSLERSPRRPSPSAGARSLHPESFAPGPFRNTIQSFWSAMGRDGRAGDTSHTSSTHVTAESPHYTPPSLPPLAFEEENRTPSGTRPGNTNGEFSDLYRNESNETSTNPPSSRNSLPPLDLASHGLGDFFLEDFGSLAEANILDQIFMSPAESMQSYLRGDETHAARPSSYRPPWRSSHPPRVPPSDPPPVPSDLHNFLMRHPRLEAVRRDVGRRVTPSQGDENGFNHALDVLRQDGLSSGRSQELLNRYRERERQRDPRLHTTPTSPWGILDQGQGGGPSRQTAPTSNSSNVEPPLLPRRRRASMDPMSMDLDDDDTGAGTAFDRARLMARRFRGESYVFPRRVGTFVRTGGGVMRRGRPLGDYVRDEDFNGDYETLLSLAESLGEVKTRSTPDEVVASMETGLFKDWKTQDSDHRCPICLDDYEPDDSVLKLPDCSHWLHQGCLQQWLRGATTCPVCRRVVGAKRATVHRPIDHSGEPGPSRRRGPGDGPGGSGSGGTAGGFSGPGTSSDGAEADDWARSWRYN